MRIGDLDLLQGDLDTHVRIKGDSGKGKSTLLYQILVELVMGGAGFALIDPHGEVYDQILSYLAYTDCRFEDVTLLDATKREITATVNPFTSTGEDDVIETKAQVLTDMTLQVWDRDSEAVRAERILSAAYTILLERGLPLSKFFDLFLPGAVDPSTIRNSFAREDWLEVQKVSSKDSYTSFMSSIRTRLKPLAHSRLHALTDPAQAIDFNELVQGNILLCNLSRSDMMGPKSGKALTAFIVAELWATMFTRMQRSPPFFLVIDEFAAIANDELAEVLTQAQKFGLHLIFLDVDSGMPKSVRDVLNNVSLLIEAKEKGEFKVQGWGSGTNYFYLTPERVPNISEELKEEYRDMVTIEPRPILSPTPLVMELQPAPTPFLLEPKPERIRLQPVQEGKGGAEHRRMQEDVRAQGINMGFKATVEKDEVDVVLERDGASIAVEVSWGNDPEYEARSVAKNRGKYTYAVVVTHSPKKVQRLKALGVEVLDYPGFHRFLASLQKKRDWMTTKEFADERGFSVEQVRKWCREKQIPSYRVGERGEYRINREAVAAWTPPDMKLVPRKIVAPKKKKDDPDGFREIMGIP